jgi:hypothetical protein
VEAPGEWRYEEGWPIARIRERMLHPQPNHTLAEAVPPPTDHRLRNVPTSAIEAAGPVMWFGDVAPDQRPTDAWSLVYDTDPLAEDVEILGLPRALLEVSADAPLAQWYARLSDIAPDGTVTLVASAGRNGAHRESSESPKPIEPGRVFPLEIEMHFTSWTFPKGHRIRLAIHNTHWPMLWPSPYPVTTTLHLGSGTRVALPIVPFEDRPRPRFLPPAEDPKLAGYGTLQEETTSGYGEISRIERDVARHSTRVTALNSGASQYPWGESRYEESIVHEAQDDHPETASVRGEHRIELKLPDRTLAFESRITFRGDATSFYYTGTRRLLKDGTLVREKVWEDAIPRDFQ